MTTGIWYFVHPLDVISPTGELDDLATRTNKELMIKRTLICNNQGYGIYMPEKSIEVPIDLLAGMILAPAWYLHNSCVVDVDQYSDLSHEIIDYKTIDDLFYRRS